MAKSTELDAVAYTAPASIFSAKADSGNRAVMVTVHPTGGFMDAQFRVAPLSADFVFGSLAPSILADLASRYESEAGIEVRHWAMWVFANGCTVPVPTQIDNSNIPSIRACQLLKQTLEQVARVEMRSMTEADRFVLSIAIGQLDELRSLGVV